MEDINSVVLVGRLTRDAEVSYSNSGYAIGKISIAVNSRKKQGNDWIDEANFLDATLFGKRAESLQQYLVKGTQVALTGQLKQSRWESNGEKRSKVSIDIANIQLLSKASANQDSPNYLPKQEAPKSDRFEDDVPF